MATATLPRVEYPSSDGKPMAENTRQYDCIVTLVSNLADLYSQDPNVFVAGDNLIYPVQGDNTICMAPDVYVAIGRPKGVRPSYQVWNEGGIFPQVVFEVLSPSNRAAEMLKKLKFYELYGAQEYFIYDPDRETLEVYVRHQDKLKQKPIKDEYQSPILKMIFRRSDGKWQFYHPDGSSPFATNQEVFDGKRLAEQAALVEKKARQEAEAKALAQEQARKEAEAKVEYYKAKLRELGLED